MQFPRSKKVKGLIIFADVVRIYDLIEKQLMDRMMGLTFHEVCDAASAFGFNFGSSTLFANLESKGNLLRKKHQPTNPSRNVRWRNSNSCSRGSC
jgi:hypothetical protein